MDAPSCTPDDLLTTAQVARLASRTIATVNRWAASGALTVYAQANGRLYHRNDVEAFLASLTQPVQQ